MPRTVLILVGPTGSGKSQLALLLAKRLGGEIISCDSMQVYRGMDIGTAKPTRTEQKAVRHHLLDLVSPRRECSVFQHREMALRAIEDICERSRLPILVGGSGLYVKAIVDGLAPQPGKQSFLRRKLEARAEREGLDRLYAQLKTIDPERAKAVHPHDQRRIVRALEVFKSSDRLPTDWRRETRGLNTDRWRPVMFGLLRDRRELYERIERRVERMMERGWLREVKQLGSNGFSKTARVAIGYCELLDHLRRKTTLEEAIERIKKRTRQIAKRQMTWFRRDKRICWITLSGDGSMERVAKSIARELER